MTEQQRRGQLALELRCPDGQVKSASFTPDPEGGSGIFSCAIGPLTNDEVSELERAARTDIAVRLQFKDHPLLLDHVSVERKGPLSVRIIGHVVKVSRR